MKQKDRRLSRVIHTAVANALAAHHIGQYDPTVSVLTIHFAPGGKHDALSIPYRRWDNRTDISLPYRLTDATDE